MRSILPPTNKTVGAPVTVQEVEESPQCNTMLVGETALPNRAGGTTILDERCAMQMKDSVDCILLNEPHADSNANDDEDEEEVPIQPFGKVTTGGNIDKKPLFLSGKPPHSSEHDTADTEETETSDITTTNTESEERSGGTKVAFGRAHFNLFRMTLGNNPSVHKGVPIQLSDEKLGSVEYSLSDPECQEHEDNNKNKDSKKVRQYTLEQRMKIAKENHTFRSVSKITQEVQQTKKNRLESKQENLETALAKEEKLEQKASSKKSNKGIGSILFGGGLVGRNKQEQAKK